MAVCTIYSAGNPIQRIKEAAPTVEGAVLFLEKISSAIEEVDSPSGALGCMANRARNLDLFADFVIIQHTAGIFFKFVRLANLNSNRENISGWL